MVLTRLIAAASGVEKMTVSNVVRKVTDAILSIAPEWIKLPRPEEIQQIKQSFYEVITFYF